MIRITNLNKYFYKNSDKQIHVINNTSLQLPDTGLITFLGKSGCGKTTLLNVIGGLDKQNSGTIEYDDLTLEKYKMNKMDLYRQENIGYIFQNYLLLEDHSVYDNLKIALELIGIYDAEEQQKRIQYALMAVGLFKYRKKLASRLSGGQQQRVSIARALIKQCKVIIADEPTGNLDSENSIEVMNILKKISEKTLVLLVTHNSEIASFYSDRIITLKDGTIIEDRDNESTGQLSTKNDKKIHLLDLNKDNLTNDNTNIEIYRAEDTNIDLKLVIKNNTIYIQSNQKIVLANDNGVEILNDHYEHLSNEKVKDFNFDISWYDKTKSKGNFKSFIKKFKNSITNHFHSGVKKGIFNFIFVVIGIAMAACVASFANYITVDSSMYTNENLSTIYVESDNGLEFQPYANKDIIREALGRGYVEEVYHYYDVTSRFNYIYNSARKKIINVQTFYYPYSVNEGRIIIGREPVSKNEVVIGKALANSISSQIKGLNNEALINQKLGAFTICGISDSNNNSAYILDRYLSADLFEDRYTGWNDISYVKEIYTNVYYKDYEEYKVTKGNDIVADNEVLVSSNCDYGRDFINSSFEYNGKVYTIVGYFSSKDNMGYLYQDNYYCELITKDASLLGRLVVCDGESLYVEEREFYVNYEYRSKDFYSSDLEYQIVQGRDSSSETEVVVNVYSPLKIGDEVYLSNGNYTVVGKYKVKNNYQESNQVIVDNKAYRSMIFENYFRYNIAYKIANTDAAKAYFEENDLKVCTLDEYYHDYVAENNAASRKVALIIGLVLLVICMVYIYFTTRSKLINQIRQIGVYRSIGATKHQMMKKYLLEIFVDTTTTCQLGYILTILIITIIKVKISSILGTSAGVSVGIYFLGFLLIYVMNFAIGMIPVLSLLNKTPSEINSKYDI